MLKLIRGIIDFRKNMLPNYRDTFARLALGQQPDTLFIACSDSRVVPNLFASSEPGDLFVIRNVGGLISPCDGELSSPDASEAAAIEFSLASLPIRDIVICGHSECGAMCAALDGSVPAGSPHLSKWLQHAKPSVAKLKQGVTLNPSLAPHNQLSQLNVLQQIEHLKTYPAVRKKQGEGSLRIHGWWFDIKHADVYAYDSRKSNFRIIDNDYAENLFKVYDRLIGRLRESSSAADTPVTV